MKRSMRQCVLSVIIAACMCISIMPCAFASNSIDLDDTDKLITFEQYYNALQAEFEKNNIGFSIANPNYDFVCTQEFLNEQLDFIRTYANSITITPTPLDTTVMNCGVSLPYQSNRVMPMHFGYATSYVVNSDIISLPGSANFVVNISGDLDIQSDNVMWIDTYTVTKRQSTNLDSYTIEDKDYSTNGSLVVYSFNITANFEWNNPYDHLTYQTSVPFWVFNSFDANEYC